jgi:hypothetical protein
MSKAIKSSLLNIIIISVLLHAVSSVKSQNHVAKSINESNNYQQAIQLKKGNFWVYQSKTIQLESGLTLMNQNDSVFIRSDTLMLGHRYYKIENIYGLSEWKRDSLKHIVDSQGQIEFTSVPTTDTLYNGPMGLGFMSPKEEKITVPAGTFSTLSFYVIQKSPAEANQDPNNPTFFNDKYSIVRKIWYAKNIGVVKSVSYYGSSTAYEKNLIRYKVK